MEMFSKDLQTLSMEVINTEKKEMLPLTNNEIRYYETRKYCHIFRNKLYNDENDKKYNKYHQVKFHDHYAGKFSGAAYSICNLRYCTTTKIPVISHHGSNYDYHFIINELAKEFKGQGFNCLGEKTEKDVTIKVPLKKTNENNKLVPHKLKFIDSNRFMNASLSCLADNLSEINKQECQKLQRKV